MLIELDHPQFRSVELLAGTLTIHFMQGEARTLQENVLDVVLTLQDDELRIVAFLDQAYAWCYRGKRDLQSERLELSHPYAGGGQLVNDGQGHSHLFYFIQVPPGQSYLLRHQILSDTWSTPTNVATNVSRVSHSFGVSWHDDGYLHLIYCSHKDQHLLYRVYSIEEAVWSGAISFSDQVCTQPQVISAGKLYVFWQEESRQVNLNVRVKMEHWSQTSLVSTGQQHVSNVGYSVLDNNWNVYWLEGTRFFKAPFDSWSEREVVDRADFDYTWVVHEHLTLPFYRVKGAIIQPQSEPMEERKVIPSEETPPSAEQEEQARQVAEQEKAREKRANEEAKLQVAFMEQAFHTLTEWEKVRGEMKRWQREFKLPEPVDLTPLTTRLERLERRILSSKQSQEEQKNHWETRANQMERELGRLKVHLAEIEEQQKRRDNSFWRRVLGRG